MSQTTAPETVFDPCRWGLPAEAVQDLAARLRHLWVRFRPCFTTQTRDTSENALVYLRGLLTLATQRNFANIARRVVDPEDDGQVLQQFMSDSPWSAQAVFDQIQAEIRQRPALQDGMLTLDESGDECAGPDKAGAARQYLGREGKVDLGQVGVGLGYYQDGTWTLVAAELYLPADWFDEDHADLRRRWHIPADRTCQTKPELGRQLIRQAQANGLPFAVVGCDSLYGRDRQFRADLDAMQLVYMADIPVDTQVYLERPVVGVPETPPGQRGRPFSQPRVLHGVQPVEVRAVAARSDTVLQPSAVRHTERGLLTYPCAARRVWTLTEAGPVREEWLFIRQEPDDTCSFALSNAPATTPLAHLARWRAQRYFAERIYQDAKSEAGWAELVARKYRAWLHHTALDALALWFIAETKLDWAQAQPRDPALVQQLAVAVLPALSMANVRELLQAVLPLKRLSPEEATRLVVRHLVKRARSTSCRLQAQCRNRGPT
jgi:SRSO17 transposase